MKKIILIVLASLPAFVFAQGGKYSVQGTLGNYNAPAKVYLQYHSEDKMIVDSVILNNGKFKFEGKLTDDPIMATLMFNAKGTGVSYDDTKQIYLESGLNIVSSTGKLREATIRGTQSNTDNEKYHEAEAALNSASDALSAVQNNATPEKKQTEAYKKEYDRALKTYMDQEAAIDKKFMQENPDSYISLVILGSYAYSADYKDIAPIFNGLSDRMKATVRGKHFAERMPHLKAVALGATAPEFAEADTSGNMVALSSFRGKYVLIDFWASWCGPCRQENPNVVRAFNRYKGQNFTVVGVSLDAPGARDRWLGAIHKDGLAWTQVSDLKYWDSKTAGLYGVRAIPQYFLIDPDGKIIAKNLRGDALENKLEEIFGKI